MPGAERSEVYYRWTDAEGRLHLVSSLDKVPAAERARAERIELRAGNEPAPAAGLTSLAGHSWLVLVGAGVVLLLLFWRFAPNGLRWTAKLGAFALIVALLGGLYLGVLRRATGSSGDVLAAPSAIIHDAERAVERMNRRQKEQEAELGRIRSEAR